MPSTTATKKACGHPRFEGLTRELADLHLRKNGGYSGDPGRPLANFERVGKLLSMYDLPGGEVGALLGFELKHIDFVLANSARAYHEPKIAEALLESLRDIAVYSLIHTCVMRDYMESGAGSVPRSS